MWYSWICLKFKLWLNSFENEIIIKQIKPIDLQSGLFMTEDFDMETYCIMQSNSEGYVSCYNRWSPNFSDLTQ